MNKDKTDTINRLVDDVFEGIWGLNYLKYKLEMFPDGSYLIALLEHTFACAKRLRREGLGTDERSNNEELTRMMFSEDMPLVLEKTCLHYLEYGERKRVSFKTCSKTFKPNQFRSDKKFCSGICKDLYYQKQRRLTK